MCVDNVDIVGIQYRFNADSMRRKMRQLYAGAALDTPLKFDEKIAQTLQSCVIGQLARLIGGCFLIDGPGDLVASAIYVDAEKTGGAIGA